MFKILREMRRRRLFRTAIIYFIAAWVIVQVSDLAFEAFGIAEEALRRGEAHVRLSHGGAIP